MDPRIVGAFGAHAGVLSRRRLVELGAAPAEIRRFVRNGQWVRVRRGIYTTAEIWAALDEHVGRPRLRARAAILQMRHGWVLSHDSSAHEQGMAILTPANPYVHVTRPGFSNAWTENGVKHHLARIADGQVIETNGSRVLDLARTAIDIARERGTMDGMVACDSAMRMGTPRSALQLAVAPMERWPGSRAARTCVSVADARAENPHESLGRHLVLEAGIGVPQTQFPVRTSQGVRWCDILVGNHVIETDGRVKYRSVADGGVATTSADEVAWEERKRERLVRDCGVVVTRIYWADYWGARRVAAIRRLQADHADAVARYGVELNPELARAAEAIRRSSPRSLGDTATPSAL